MLEFIEIFATIADTDKKKKAAMDLQKEFETLFTEGKEPSLNEISRAIKILQRLTALFQSLEARTRGWK